jgi:hypothetical protein
LRTYIYDTVAGACVLQVDVCQWELQAKDASSSAASSSEALGVKAKLWPNAAVWPHLPQLLHASKAGSGDRSASLLDWSLLQQLLRDGQYQGQGGLQLHAGGRGALLPAKYETHDRLLCQVGRAWVAWVWVDCRIVGSLTRSQTYERLGTTNRKMPQSTRYNSAITC